MCLVSKKVRNTLKDAISPDMPKAPELAPLAAEAPTMPGMSSLDQRRRRGNNNILTSGQGVTTSANTAQKSLLGL